MELEVAASVSAASSRFSAIIVIVQPTIGHYLGPLVPVPVMQIGPVGMGMRQGMMVVRMVVRFARRVVLAMHMPVMLIVDVTVGVIENIVGVVMEMPLGKMQPCTQSHQQPRHHDDRC